MKESETEIENNLNRLFMTSVVGSIKWHIIYFHTLDSRIDSIEKGINVGGLLLMIFVRFFVEYRCHGTLKKK